MKKYIYSVLGMLTVLFLCILPLGQDLHFHLYRIGAMAEELKRLHGVLPIRMLSVTYNNYGYAVPFFYRILFFL